MPFYKIFRLGNAQTLSIGWFLQALPFSQTLGSFDISCHSVFPCQPLFHCSDLVKNVPKQQRLKKILSKWDLMPSKDFEYGERPASRDFDPIFLTISCTAVYSDTKNLNLSSDSRSDRSFIPRFLSLCQSKNLWIF